MLTGFPCIQCYGLQQCHTILDQTAYRDRGVLFCSLMLSPVRYIAPLVNFSDVPIALHTALFHLDKRNT